MLIYNQSVLENESALHVPFSVCHSHDSITYDTVVLYNLINTLLGSFMLVCIN